MDGPYTVETPGGARTFADKDALQAYVRETWPPGDGIEGQLFHAGGHLLIGLGVAVEEATGQLLLPLLDTATGFMILVPANLTDEKQIVLPVPADFGTCTRFPGGTRWEHYKGGTYCVLGDAFVSGIGKHYVIYHSEAKDTLWARAVADWFETAPDGKTPRFKRVHSPV
jgi:hypothetical protein